MSTIGSPIETSLIQAANAQQHAGRAREKERGRSEGSRKLQDRVDLRVAGLESTEAVHKVPGGETEQDHAEQNARQQPQPKEQARPKRPRIDLKA